MEELIGKTRVHQWEYRIEFNTAGFGETSLNEIGAEGWELCSSYKDLGYYFYYFKRPLS